MNCEPTVLIVGEDTGVAHLVSSLGVHAIAVSGPQEAVAKGRDLAPALVLVNLPTGTVESGVLHTLSTGGTPVLLLGRRAPAAGPATPKNGKNGRHGTIHVLEPPVPEGTLRATLQTLLKESQSGARRSPGGPRPGLGDRYRTEYAPLLGHSRPMQAVREVIEQVADTTATVLIRGESGVGKDIVARAIHAAGPRQGHPYVKVNCAACPMDLLESELFGHEKGAFTGAYQRKLGKFEAAHQGTIFLDEIGELPVALQAKLLHVLQDQEFPRVGGRQMIQVDTRVIASTNRNLEAALQSGQFREDLYYRLNVVEIRVPPLRERKEEIPILADYFLARFNQRRAQRVTLPAETATLFTAYPWPGNIRELENLILRLVVLGNVRHVHEEILHRLRTLAPKPAASPASADVSPAPAGPPPPPLGLREVARRAAQEAERRAIQEVLDRVHWNRSEAARLLKVSYKTLLAKITDCGLASKQTRSQS